MNKDKNSDKGGIQGKKDETDLRLIVNALKFTGEIKSFNENLIK